MDKKVLTILENIEKRLTRIEQSMVTKEEAQNFATKTDLGQFATKDDLKTLATKKDLTKFVTKNDLAQLKKELMEYTDGWVKDIIGSIDKNKAEQIEVNALRKRIERIEQRYA